MAKTDNGGIDDEIVRKLADLLNETGLTEIEYGRDDWHIRVSKGVTQAAAAVAPPLMTAPAGIASDAGAADSGGGVPSGAVASPMVGVVYLSADPGSAPYVTVGDQVAEGDTLCLIEAMKVFNPIRSPRAGKVTRILVNSGAPVEYGEALVVVE